MDRAEVNKRAYEGGESLAKLYARYDRLYEEVKHIYKGDGERKEMYAEAEKFKCIYGKLDNQEKMLDSIFDGFRVAFENSLSHLTYVDYGELDTSEMFDRMKHLDTVAEGVNKFVKKFGTGSSVGKSGEDLVRSMRKVSKLVTDHPEAVGKLDEKLRKLAFGNIANETRFWGGLIGEGGAAYKMIDRSIRDSFNVQLTGSETMARDYWRDKGDDGSAIQTREFRSGVVDLKATPKKKSGFRYEMSVSIKNYDLRGFGTNIGTYSLQTFNLGRIYGELMHTSPDHRKMTSFPDGELPKTTAAVFHLARYPRDRRVRQGIGYKGSGFRTFILKLYEVFYILGFQQTFRVGTKDQVLLFLANDKMFLVPEIFPTKDHVSKGVGKGYGKTNAIRETDTGSTHGGRRTHTSSANTSYGRAWSEDVYLAAYLKYKYRLKVHITARAKSDRKIH